VDHCNLGSLNNSTPIANAMMPRKTGGGVGGGYHTGGNYSPKKDYVRARRANKYRQRVFGNLKRRM